MPSTRHISRLVVALAVMLSCGCSSRPTIEPLPQLGSAERISDLVVVYASEVSPGGEVEERIAGVTLKAESFDVDAEVYVQICEDILGLGGCFEPAPAQFRVTIAPDSTAEACVRLVEEIHSYWLAKDERYLASARSLPAEKHAFYDPEWGFVLFDSPNHNRPGASWVFYLRGTAVVVHLVDFDMRLGVGALQSFIEDSLVLTPTDGVALRPTYKSFLDPNQLLDLLSQGQLSCPELLAP